MAKKGNIPWIKGRHHTKEAIEKNRLAHLGKHLSEEHKQKISLAEKGKVLSEETKQKISIVSLGKKKKYPTWNKGKKKSYTQEDLVKIREKRKKYNKENRDIKNKKSRERNQKLKQEFLLYKMNKCCSICGYKEHPEILQFHHKDKRQKEFTIGSLMPHKRNSLEVKKEIEKCILLCPNCHYLLHFKERNKEI